MKEGMSERVNLGRGSHSNVDARSSPPTFSLPLSPPPLPPRPSNTPRADLSMAARAKIQNQSQYSDLPDIHMNTAKGLTVGLPDVRMATAKGMTIDDIHMDTAKAGTTLKAGFKMWEKELIDSPEVRRKATVAQLC